jgi:acetyltransferase
MQRIIDYQRGHGTKKLVATVLRENSRMLALALRLGFVEKPSDDGDDLRAIEREL